MAYLERELEIKSCWKVHSNIHRPSTIISVLACLQAYGARMETQNSAGRCPLDALRDLVDGQPWLDGKVGLCQGDPERLYMVFCPEEWKQGKAVSYIQTLSFGDQLLQKLDGMEDIWYLPY
jgi:hypothetical protein